MARWQLVCWDFDGTLANTAPDVWRSLEYAAGLLGGGFTKEFRSSDANLSLAMDEILAAIRPPVPASELAAFDDAVRVHYRELSTHELTELYPGVAEVLERLREAGSKCVIVTNKPRLALERILGLKGWAGLFDGWVCANDGGGEALSKSQMIGIALERFDARADEACMVGDSAGDVAGARAAGIASVAVTYGDGNRERLVAELPDYTVDAATGLEAVLLGS